MNVWSHTAALALAVALPASLQAQHSAPDHAAHAGQTAQSRPAAGALPTLPGQDAYGAIGEIVRLLEADPSTDWTKVNLEGLRQHLIDMNEVTLEAAVSQRPIPGGIEADVTGEGRTAAAIRRMVRSHSTALEGNQDYRASYAEIPGGARLTVTAERSGDEKLVAKIRGLGFIGLMTADSHHMRHHLAMARGTPVAGHERGH